MEQLESKKKIAIMIAIMAAMLFAALNQTIISTAMPRIVSELHGMAYFSWIFTIFMLTSTIAAVLSGKFSDLYGRKPLILIGISVFMLGSFLAGLADTIIQLIIYRGVQGIGAGMIMSTAFASVGDLFAPRERGRWQGLMGGVFGLASVFGPTLGGYIVDHMDWHWVFWVFLPVGVLAFVCIAILFPTQEKKAKEPIDYWGSLLLSTCIIPLLLAFTWAGHTYAWHSPIIIGLFAGAFASFILFITVERRVESPVLPLTLFKNNSFTISNLVGFMMGAGMFGAVMYMPWFVQGVIGTSATISGYVMMPMTLSLVLASAISGQLITKTGKYKMLALAGLLIMAVGMGLLMTMDSETTNGIAVIYMIVVGFGLGISFPIFTLTVQNAAPQNSLGVATASSQLFRQLGGTIGVALMGSVLSQRMSSSIEGASMEATLEQAEVDISSQTSQATNALQSLQDPQVLMNPAQIQSIQAALPDELRSVMVELLHQLRESLSYALHGVFITGLIVVIVALLLTLGLKEVPLRSSSTSNNP
jgi:EmrB/QacA subfamily drug resistance transporter